MAVTAREQLMLDLHEQGLSPTTIASRLGIKVESVRRGLTLLSGSPAADNAREAAIRRGSQQLLAAINRARFPAGDPAVTGQRGFIHTLIDRPVPGNRS